MSYITYAKAAAREAQCTHREKNMLETPKIEFLRFFGSMVMIAYDFDSANDFWLKITKDIFLSIFGQ